MAMGEGFATYTLFNDADAFASAFRHVDVEFRCQERGPFCGRLGFTALQGTEVQHLSLNQTSVSHAFNGLGRFALLVQLRSPRPCVWNGYTMRGPSVLAYGSGAEHAGAEPGGMECAVVSYPHERVVNMAQGGGALQGLRRLQAGCHQVDLSPLDYGALAWRVMQLNALASTQPAVLREPAICEAFESLLEESLLTVLAPTAAGSARPTSRHQLLEAIRRAEDYLEASPQPSWRLSGLCAGADIDASVLRQACAELFGLRATRYLALFRLERLRRDLLASTEGAEDVAALARRWGFWNLPWLRLWYRRRFGETIECTRRRGLLAHGC
jgi:AraC-like DNA-binding protein